MSHEEMPQIIPEPEKALPPISPEKPPTSETEKDFRTKQLQESLDVLEKRLSKNPNPGLKAALEAQKMRLQKKLEKLENPEKNTED